MIKNIIFGVYLLISDFLSEHNLAKKVTHFTMQFRSKNLTHFTNLYLLNIIKKILPQHSQKHVSGWYQEQKLCCIDAQNLHSRSTWKALPLYDCKYQFGKFCSRNVESIIISFREIAFWGS